MARSPTGEGSQGGRACDRLIPANAEGRLDFVTLELGKLIADATAAPHIVGAYSVPDIQFYQGTKVLTHRRFVSPIVMAGLVPAIHVFPWFPQ
jgi:hypothetical protein